MMTTQNLNLNGSIKFGNIPITKLNSTFNDGRVLGLLMDTYLESEYQNVKVSSDDEGNTNITLSEDGKEYRVECRIFTKRGANLVPSIMLGGNRHFDQYAYDKWINELDGFVIVDIRDFPKVSVSAVPKNNISNNCTKLGKIQYNNIIGQYKKV